MLKSSFKLVFALPLFERNAMGQYYVIQLDLYKTVGPIDPKVLQCYNVVTRKRGIRCLLDIVVDAQASLCAAVYAQVSLREASSWGSEYRVLLSQNPSEMSAYLIHPLSELLF